MNRSGSSKALEHSNDHPLLASWNRHLRAEGKAETTFSNYLLAVRQFTEFAAGEGIELPQADRALIETWLVELHGKLAPATVATRYIGLRLFFDWLVSEDEIPKSPFGGPMQRRIRPPEVPESPKDVVDPEVLIKLFKILDKGKRWRDAVIISVLYDTGMRASELADCLAEDVDIERGTILLPHTKGKRPRLVGISPATCRYIDRYWRKPSGRKMPDYLVNGIKGRMTRSGIYQIVAALFREAGVDGTIIGVHDLRHTSATHITIDGGLGETQLMDLYGWRSAEMARHYTAQARQHAALEAHRKFGPMQRLMDGKRQK